jgi:transcriptional regulator with XRE-family HTH domain
MQHQFSERFLELRQRTRLSQEAFGDKIGLTKSTVCNIETKYRNKTGITFDKLLTISDTFNVTTDWLLGRVDPNEIL